MGEKKPIIVVTKTMGIDGPERVISELTHQWVEAGYEVTVIVTHAEPGGTSYDFSDRIRILYTDAHARGGKLARLREIFQVRKILKQYPDAVCVSLILPSLFSLAMAAVGLPNRVVISERNDPRQVPFTALQRKMRDLAMEQAEACVFQTEDAMKYFSQRVQKKGTIIYNPVNPNLPPRDNGPRNHTIIAVGRLAVQKNFAMLIRAFALFAPEHPEYTLKICGEGPEREMLERMIDEAGLKDRILLPGFSDNVYAEMTGCAMYVSSSDFEGMSNSMLEALAMGLPVICTDCPAGGAHTVIRSGENGLLVPVGDAEAMAAAMARLADDSVFADTLADHAYVLREELQADKISREWLKVMGEI